MSNRNDSAAQHHWQTYSVCTCRLPSFDSKRLQERSQRGGNSLETSSCSGNTTNVFMSKCRMVTGHSTVEARGGNCPLLAVGLRSYAYANQTPCRWAAEP